jgi:hypothetical protein
VVPVVDDGSPTTRARVLAVALWALAMALVGVSVALALVRHRSIGWPSADDQQMAFMALIYPTVGLVIARHRPRNAIGWLFLAIGPWAGLSALASSIQGAVPLSNPASPTGADVAEWLNQWVWVPPWFAIPTFLVLLFPDGRLPSRRWRPVAWLAGAAIGLTFVAGILSPDGSGGSNVDPSFVNPVVRMSTAVDRLTPIGFLMFLAAVGLSIASLVVRFRQSRGLEREQLKWFVFAAVLTVALGVGATVSVHALWLKLLGFVAIAVIPIACLIAIMRYRLYAIDRLISRTVVYFMVTAVLIGVYAAIVVGVGALTGRSDDPVVIAGATLAVAALFRPLLRGVKSAVDRRFARRRYDAQRALEAFAAGLRDEVDLEQVRASLVGTVRETVQPDRATLWLRPEGAAR